MQRTTTTCGTDVTSDAKKFMWLKKYLKERGADPSKVDSLYGRDQLQRYGQELGLLRSVDEAMEDTLEGNIAIIAEIVHSEPAAAPRTAPAPKPAAPKPAASQPSWQTRSRPAIRFGSSKPSAKARENLAKDHPIATQFTWMTESDPDGCKGFVLNSALANIGRVKCVCGADWKAHPDSLGVEDARKCIGLAGGGSKKMSEIKAPDELGGGGSGVYVGGLHDAKRHSTLEKAGVTHVLNTADRLDIVDGSFKEDDAKFTYLRLGLNDNKEAANEMRERLEDCFQFIEAALAQGGKVLVHCAQGKSRSGTVAVMWVMRKYQLNYDTALALIQRVRGIVEPNAGFEKMLRRYALKELGLR